MWDHVLSKQSLLELDSEQPAGVNSLVLTSVSTTPEQSASLGHWISWSATLHKAFWRKLDMCPRLQVGVLEKASQMRPSKMKPFLLSHKGF